MHWRCFHWWTHRLFYWEMCCSSLKYCSKFLPLINKTVLKIVISCNLCVCVVMFYSYDCHWIFCMTGILCMWRWGIHLYKYPVYILCITVACCPTMMCNGGHSELSYVWSSGLKLLNRVPTPPGKSWICFPKYPVVWSWKVLEIKV